MTPSTEDLEEIFQGNLMEYCVYLRYTGKVEGPLGIRGTGNSD